MIARKPVPVRSKTTPAEVEAPGKKELGIPGSKDLSLDTNISEPPNPPSKLISSPSSSTPTPLGENKQPLTWPLSTPSSRQKAQSTLKSAYEEARHFAGGLISHPYESTSHYSILRHSTGIVVYKGSYTNLAITIFSDGELPADRTLWLQRKGWTGKLGLRAGTLGKKTSWIDVTPSHAVSADELPKADERAWQRDIKSFRKKASGKARTHLPRETSVLRIPCEADDGYLRVVLCAGEGGKKILCPSPVFRLFSASASPGSIKGAGLTALPLELGLKIGGMVAKAHASSAVQNLASPITGALQQYEPGFLEKEALELGYDATAAQKVNAIEQHNLQKRENEYDFATYEDELAGTAAGPEVDNELKPLTPSSPFPIRFLANLQSKAIVLTPENTQVEHNLTSVPEEILLKHDGRFCCWIKLSFGKEKISEWLPTLLIFRLERHKVTHKKVVHLVPLSTDTSEPSTETDVLKDGSGTEVILMAYLGPNYDASTISSPVSPVSSSSSPTTPMELTEPELEDQRATDIEMTLAILALPTFAPELALEQIQSGKSGRTFTDKFSDLRMSGLRKYDAIPAHRVGVRTVGQKLRDQLVGKGGLYVKR